MEQTFVGNVRRVDIEAVITRADGTVVNLGTVASTAWKWWSPRGWVARFAAWRRIKDANRRV